MKQHYRFCQSCGMPLEQNSKDMRGTEKDGAVSMKYCTYCYQKGVFSMADTIDTPQKMQEMCIKQMKKQGMNGILAWILTRQIPTLERWRR